MESPTMELHDLNSYGCERPSPDFIRAVAELLETDATDLLSEMGYSSSEAILAVAEAVPA